MREFGARSPMLPVKDSATDDDVPQPVRGGRPRILFLIDEMEAITAGGTERQLLQLAAIAARSGLQPEICVFRGTEWLTAEVAGCPVAHFDVRSVRTTGGLRSLWRLTRWMRSRKFSIVVTLFSEANLLGPWLAKAAGVPAVIGTRRNLKHAMADSAGFGLKLQWVSNLLVREILANSEAVRQSIAADEWFSASKIRVIYNGLDTAALQPPAGAREDVRSRLRVSPEQVLVGNISGLREIKGVMLFLDAAEQAWQRDGRLRFVMVGDGELRAAMEEAVDAKGMREVFWMAGAAVDVRPYLAAMDIAVLSSYAEGFSNSLLEYMAAGLPIVATDVGGNREALEGAGILVPAGDAAALAKAILELRDAAKRKELSAAATARIRRFDISAAEREMQEVFLRNLPRRAQ